MDKVTSGIIDKLSIIGSFNVIISGAVLIYGLSPVWGKYVPAALISKLDLENNAEIVIVMCLICFVFGCALQAIQKSLFKGLKSAAIDRCLSNGGTDGKSWLGKCVITNKYKRKCIINLAAKLFADKQLGEFDPKDKEMCRYFVDYCNSSNSIRGNSGSSSRYSEAATIYEQLASAFYVLVIVGVLISVFGRTGEWLYCLVYLAMSCIFTGMAYQSHRNWVKTVLTTYEVVSDQPRTK